MKIEITKNQRDLISGLNGKTTATLEVLKAAQVAAHFAQEQYDLASSAMNGLLSCLALDAGADKESQIAKSSVIEEDGKFFLVLEPSA